MWISLLVTIGLAAAGLGGGIYVGQRRLDQKNKAVVDALLAAAAAPTQCTVQTSNLDTLPAPIQRYLRHVLPPKQSLVQTVRLEQSGTFRSCGSGAEWNVFTATQHVTSHPPGFVWDAYIWTLPGLSVRVLDAYVDGHGALWARLGGVIPVADPTPGPALDEGELLRYLAEAPLYPTVLLPGRGVTWTGIDDRSARVTLNHRGTTASLVFHVNDRDEVECVTGERPFLTDDGTYEDRPWKGTWHNYERRDGLRVPTDGEVAWISPSGEDPYWRGHMETIDYQFVDCNDLDVQCTSDSP